MANFDLEEQEQIDAMKAFWQQWGKWLFAVLLLALAAYAGHKTWRYFEHQKALAAAAEYEKLEDFFAKAKRQDAEAQAKIIIQNHPNSSFAVRAQLFLAQLRFQAKDYDGAQAALNAVLQSKHANLHDLARSRLVMVLLDAKKFDAALSELDKTHDEAFAALFLDLRGDVLLARGDRQGAKQAYEKALAQNTQDRPLRNLIQMKLDALGVTS